MVEERRFYILEKDDKSTSFDPEGQEFSNCQLLGEGKGNSPEEALKDFKKRKEWIKDSAYNEIFLIEIIGEEIDTTLDSV